MCAASETSTHAAVRTPQHLVAQANREARRHVLHAAPHLSPRRVEALWCRLQEIYSSVATEHLIEFGVLQTEEEGRAWRPGRDAPVVHVTSVSPPTREGASWRVVVDLWECSQRAAHPSHPSHCRDPSWVVLRRALLTAMAHLIACHTSETAHHVARTVFFSALEPGLVAFSPAPPPPALEYYGKEEEEEAVWRWSEAGGVGGHLLQDDAGEEGGPAVPGTWCPFPGDATTWGALQWRHNSCYIDALLMILFTSDARTAVAPLLSRAPGPDVPPTHQRVLDALHRVRRRLHRGEWFDCMDLRAALLPFAPGVQDAGTGAWLAYEAETVYDIFTDVLPSLKTHYTQLTRTDGTRRRGVPSRRGVAFFQAWDFMEDPRASATGSTYAEILWGTITSPLLVFHNGGVPPIARFHETGWEDLGRISLGGGHVVNDAGTVHKVRALGDTLLRGAYELVGVVMLTGTVRGEGGCSGGHYTAYLRVTPEGGAPGAWFHYDDTRRGTPPCLRVGGSTGPACAPPAVWHDWNRRKPVLWFYRRRTEGGEKGRGR